MLPRYDQRSTITDDAADYGTLVHWWKETGETAPSWASAADIRLLEEKLALTCVERTRWWRSAGQHEVSFAIRVADAHLELYRGPRPDAEKWKAKWDPRKYLTGTIDWLWWGASGRAWVDDLKCGKWPVDPVTSAQLRSYALVPWIRAGCPPAFTVTVSITQWPKYPKWKGPVRTPHWLTALDLELHLDDVRYALAHPEEANPEAIYIGPWDPERPLSVCAFCPCRRPQPYFDSHNYRWRAEQHCTPGLLKRFEQGK